MRTDVPHYRRTSWLDPRIEVRPSRIEGRGLFARDPIHAGEVVAVIGGLPITTAQLAEIVATGNPYSCAAIAEDVHLLQDAEDALRFGNHFCDPNLWMRDAVTIEARRVIQPGEEITTDYALMTVDPKWRMQCHCGSRECRGVIRGAAGCGVDGRGAVRNRPLFLEARVMASPQRFSVSGLKARAGRIP